jgi:hypothetical protein
MSQPVDRPLSVWITQLLLMPMLIMSPIVLSTSLFECFSSSQKINCLSQPRITSFIISFLVLVILSWTFWGLQTGKIYGKWLAIILLTSSIVISIAKSNTFMLIRRSILLWQPLPTPPYECWERKAMFGNFREYCGYSNYLGLMLNIISDFLPALLMGFLVVKLIYGRMNKNFFR